MTQSTEGDARRASLAEAIRRLSLSLLATDISPDRLVETEADVNRLTHILDSVQRDETVDRTTEWHLSSFNAIEGRANVAAPPMLVTIDAPGAITGRVTLSALAGGAPGRAHGGPVAALLDQAMGRAVLSAGSTSLTITLTIDYKAATPIGVPLDVTAYCESASGRALTVRGEIRHGAQVCATSVGIFLVPRENAAAVTEALDHLEQAGAPR